MKLREETRMILRQTLAQGSSYFFVSLFVSTFLVIWVGGYDTSRAKVPVQATPFVERISGTMLFLMAILFVIVAFVFTRPIHLLILIWPWLIGYVAMLTVVFFLKKIKRDHWTIMFGLTIIAVVLEYQYGMHVLRLMGGI